MTCSTLLLKLRHPLRHVHRPRHISSARAGGAGSKRSGPCRCGVLVTQMNMDSFWIVPEPVVCTHGVGGKPTRCCFPCQHLQDDQFYDERRALS